MSKRRKHFTTKNTFKAKVTRLRVIGVECNGRFDLVTDFDTQKEFDDIFQEWFDHPATFKWCAESLIAYIKTKQPKRICLLQEEYDLFVKDKVIPATKEEWESENN